MRGMRQIVSGEDERLRKPAEALLVFVGVLLQLRDYLEIRVGRGDFGFDLSGRELAFVFQEVELFESVGLDRSLRPVDPRR